MPCKMSLKKVPQTMYSLSLQQVSKMLLEKWKSSYYTNYAKYTEEFKTQVGVIIPFTIYDQIFDLMIDSHARSIQNERSCDTILGISALIDTIITPHLRKLNLNGLRHMGAVKDEEIRYLESILITELPNLTSLTEISLQTSGTDSTLPICHDEMLDKIGASCPQLKTLDVSYNHTVTDKGLEYLLPAEGRTGCCFLTKVSIFECSVTPEGVALLIEGMLWLKFLGYRETGLALLYLERKLAPIPLSTKLAHVNNLGTISRTCKDIHKLNCNEKLVNVLSAMCPKINGLKVRLSDSDVKFLSSLNTVSILDLVYNIGSPSSPGNNTIQYIQCSGSQFVSLSFVCETFCTQNLKVVCEECTSLKRLWIRSNKFVSDRDLSSADKKKCVLVNLEVFFLRVGHMGSELCHIPQSVLHYVLHKSLNLTEIVLAMKNMLFCDSFVVSLFSSLYLAKLKHLMILVPHKNVTLSSFSLSMSTVEALISMCPQLEQLGNLLVWDVSLEEIQELRRQLKISNSALTLLYRMMYS